MTNGSKNYSIGRIVRSEESPIVFVITMTILAFFLFISPFYKALFNGQIRAFESPIFVAVIGASIMALLFSVQSFRKEANTTKQGLLSLLVLLLPITYFISAFGAASRNLAYLDTLIRFLWVAFFLAGLYLAKSHFGMRIIQVLMISSGYVLVIYGFMNWFGNAEYHDALLHYQDSYLQGDRLANVFQYPNTYAAYLAALFIFSVIFLNYTKRLYIRAIISGMLVPIFLSFLLTLSRGAVFILFIAMLVYFVCIPLYKQIMTLLYVGIAGGVSLLLFKRMTSIRSQIGDHFSGTVSLNGWFQLVAASLIVAAIICLIHKYSSSKLENKAPANHIFKLSGFIVPVGILLFAATTYLIAVNHSPIIDMLPNEIKARLDNFDTNSSSSFLRNTYVEDGWTIAKNSPVIGSGGGAWSILYEQYKSFPYISRQAHDFYLQSLVEAGLLGVIVLLLMISSVIFVFVTTAMRSIKSLKWDESRLAFLLFALVLLGHSLMDFDMSYVYVSALVFLSLGVSIADNDSSSKLMEKIKLFRVRSFQKGWSIALGAVSVIILIYVIRALQASASFDKAVNIANKTGVYNDFQKDLDAAISKAPYQTEYVFLKVDILRQLYEQTKDEKYKTEAEQLISSIEKYEPLNRNLWDVKYNFYSSAGEWDEVLSLVAWGLEKFPWDIAVYERASDLYYNLGLQAHTDHKLQERDRYWSNGLMLVEKINEKMKMINYLPDSAKYISRDFNLNRNISLNISQIYLQQKKYEQVVQILEPHLSTDLNDPQNNQVLNIYLAALKAMGKEDPVWQKLSDAATAGN